jgi:hypothetical protein
MPETFNDQPVGSAVQSCPQAQSTPQPKPVHWIEIQLVGLDARPVSWEEYEITLPTGAKVRGYVDGRGRARVDNIADAGTCQITFPRLDKDAWAPLK